MANKKGYRVAKEVKVEIIRRVKEEDDVLFTQVLFEGKVFDDFAAVDNRGRAEEGRFFAN